MADEGVQRINLGQVKPETDPVCGMKVDPKTARGGSHAYAGRSYFFCNPRCRERFAADPEHWLAQGPSRAAMGAMTAPATSASPAAAAPGPAGGEGAQWICPMDPEVLEAKPGACPICGMALEPRVTSEAQGRNPELEDMTRRLRVAVALSVPLVALTMGGMLAGRHQLLPAGVQGFVELLLATPVTLWRAGPSCSGWPRACAPATSTCSP